MGPLAQHASFTLGPMAKGDGLHPVPSFWRGSRRRRRVLVHAVMMVLLNESVLARPPVLEWHPCTTCQAEVWVHVHVMSK